MHLAARSAQDKHRHQQLRTSERTFEIDLNLDNARRLRALLNTYVCAARPVTDQRATQAWKGAARRGAAERARRTAYDDIRDWARQAGYSVADRGKLSAGVLRAYAASHPSKPGYDHALPFALPQGQTLGGNGHCPAA